MSEPPPPYKELDARIIDIDGKSEVDSLRERESHAWFDIYSVPPLV
jgi:hypothetical protein